MLKTGWPPPELMQDDCRELFRWFASRPDARHLVRTLAADILKARATTLPESDERRKKTVDNC